MNNENQEHPSEDISSRIHGQSQPKDARAILNSEGRDSLRARLEATKLERAQAARPKAPPSPGEDELSDEDSDQLVGWFYYDGRNYHMEDEGQLIMMDRRSVESQLCEMGVEATGQIVNRIQRERYVSVLEGYAGKPAGLHNEDGRRFLIKTGANLIVPRPLRWKTIRRVIMAIVGDDPEVGNQQVAVLLLWLKVAYAALRAGVRTPGQAVVLAGPAGCGKSLLIDLIVAILGGRRGHPHKFITGRTSFNGELLGKEVLVSDDDAGSIDIRVRRGVAAAYKNLLFSGSVPIEQKYGMPDSFAPFWRLVIATNNEPESMLVLPPLSADIEDKINLINCHKRELPMTSSTPENRSKFFATLVSEIPGLLHDLECLEIPKGLQCARSGVRHFHHPALLAALTELTPETALLNLIDETLPNMVLMGHRRIWEGTASKLRNDLHEFSSIKSDVQNLLPAPNMVGTYLGRLEKSTDRVQRGTHKGGITVWRITLGSVMKPSEGVSRMAELRSQRISEIPTEIEIEAWEPFLPN